MKKKGFTIEELLGPSFVKVAYSANSQNGLINEYGVWMIAEANDEHCKSIPINLTKKLHNKSIANAAK
ncbi:MAG: hypothetical protein IKW92_09410 [Firmicutes bacterium]|nr:hypothetical protein [Bacillota bacterium]